MRRIYALIALFIAGIYLLVGYLMLSTDVSWESKGEFSSLSNVSYSGEVVVDMPLALDLNVGIYDIDTGSGFKAALKGAISNVLLSHGLRPDFNHVRPVVLLPGESPPNRIDKPVIILDVPFLGQGGEVYYDSYYASVLIYMNSNGDIGSYLSVERRYSGDSSKTDDLSNFARNLYETARARGDSTGNHSLKVVYWNVLRVRTGKLSGRDCWRTLAGEIAREVDEWASTLDSSDET